MTRQILRPAAPVSAHSKRRKKHVLVLRSGFTLIEVLMVVIVVAIISAVAFPQFINYSRDAKIAVTDEKLLVLKEAIVGNPNLIQNGQFTFVGYERDVGAVPGTLTDLITKPALVSAYDPLTKRGWRGPYVNSTASDWNKDAWGTTIVYDGDPMDRTLTSYGPDTVVGGTDNIEVEF